MGDCLKLFLKRECLFGMSLNTFFIELSYIGGDLYRQEYLKKIY